MRRPGKATAHAAWNFVMSLLMSLSRMNRARSFTVPCCLYSASSHHVPLPNPCSNRGLLSPLMKAQGCAYPQAYRTRRWKRSRHHVSRPRPSSIWPETKILVLSSRTEVLGRFFPQRPVLDGRSATRLCSLARIYEADMLARRLPSSTDHPHRAGRQGEIAMKVIGRLLVSALGFSLAMGLATAALAYALEIRWGVGPAGEGPTPDDGGAGRGGGRGGWGGGGGGWRRGGPRRRRRGRSWWRGWRCRGRSWGARRW